MKSKNGSYILGIALPAQFVAELWEETCVASFGVLGLLTYGVFRTISMFTSLRGSIQGFNESCQGQTARAQSLAGWRPTFRCPLTSQIPTSGLVWTGRTIAPYAPAKVNPRPWRLRQTQRILGTRRRSRSLRGEYCLGRSPVQVLMVFLETAKTEASTSIRARRRPLGASAACTATAETGRYARITSSQWHWYEAGRNKWWLTGTTERTATARRLG